MLSFSFVFEIIVVSFDHFCRGLNFLFVLVALKFSIRALWLFLVHLSLKSLSLNLITKQRKRYAVHEQKDPVVGCHCEVLTKHEFQVVAQSYNERLKPN